MPEQKQPLSISSLNPTELASGRPHHFVGIIRKSRFKAWAYPNSSGKHFFFLGWTIEPEEESGFSEFTEHYRAGWLPSEFPGTVPSNDGPDVPEGKRSPAGADWDFYAQLGAGEESIPEDQEEKYEGHYALGAALRNNTDLAQLLQALSNCDFKDFSADAACFEGLKCEFQLEAQKHKSKDAPKEYQVLVPVAIIEKIKVSPVTKVVGKGKAAGSGTTTTAKAAGNGVLGRLEEIVVSMAMEVEELDEDTGMLMLSADKLNTAVLNSNKGEYKLVEMKRAKEDPTLLATASRFTYDADRELFLVPME